jgi:transposase
MKPKDHQNPESVVREIKRQTRRKFSAEEKIRIILEGLKGEESIATICRKEGIAPTLYYKWSKAFLVGGQTPVTRGYSPGGKQ